MSLNNQSRDQLIEEIEALRQRVAELEDQRVYLDPHHQMWETLMENTPDLVYFKDIEHGIINCSQAYADAVGAKTREELIGKTASDLWPHEAQEILSDERRVLGGEPMIRKERQVTIASGETRWYLLTKIPIYEKGEISGFFAIDKDITKRKKAEQALLESESRFRRIFESNMIGISFWNEEGDITDANQAFLGMIGYNRSDLKAGKLRWAEITPEEYSERDQEAMQEIRERGIHAPFEKEYITKDGSRVPVLLGGATLEGERHLGITYAINITDRKEAMEALEESHERFITILDSLDAHIYAADMDSYEILFQNKKMRDDFGERSDSQTCYEQYRDISSPCPHCSNHKLLDEKGVPTGVNTWEGKNPLTGKWYFNYDRAIKWIDGRYVRLQIAFDITDRKRIEKELEKSEEKLRNIVEYSTNLFYIHTPDHKLTYVSPQSEHFLQCSPEEAMVHWTEFITSHPVNQKGFEATQRAIDSGERQPPFELQLIGKKGKIIWVEVNEAPLVEDGETKAIIGSLTDITKRKQAMQRDEERRMYLESILKAAPDAIVTLDAEQRVVEWNPGCKALFGYTSDEAVGELLDDLIAQDDVLEEAQNYTQMVQKGHDLAATETVRYRKDGSPVEVILAGSPIMVGDKMIGAVGVYTDISERVRMENALRAMALRDDLTGLYNRRGFNVLAEQHLKVANREKRRLILLYGDVDNMKHINDTLGHLKGDQALRMIARSLQGTFRKSDIVARIGGDEFVVLALESEKAHPEELIHRLEKHLRIIKQQDENNIPVSISMGWSIYDPHRASTLDELLILADKAMYNRKPDSATS